MEPKQVKVDLGTENENISIIRAAEDFIRQVIPPHVNPQQQSDMMLAFMAGAFALYNIQMKKAFVNGDEKTGARNMRNIAKEFEKFFGPMSATPENFKPGDKTPFDSNIKKDLGE